MNDVAHKHAMRWETRLSITEIRARWLEIRARVEAGETIVVTRHGKPVADLHPHRPADR